MPKKLEGKIAVITGGTEGIGLATAKLFVKEGAYVFITGRRQSQLDAALKQIGKNVVALQGDVSNLADLDPVIRNRKGAERPHRHSLRQRWHRRIRPARRNHRRAFRQDI
jgi:NADP-dependent 3-hydroxy acid dehydrogenase YdfG